MDASEDLRAQRLLRITALAVGSLAFWRLLFWVPTIGLGPLNAWLFLTTDPFPQTIFLISAALVYRRRGLLRRAMQGPGSPVLAAFPLLAGASLFVWGHNVDAMDLVLISFMLVSLGVGLLWFGGRFARELAVPLVVLVFAFPAPAVLTNQAFYVLRLSTAAHATALLKLVGIPVFREGNVIIASDVVAQVVDTCSGLRSMEMLALAAVFFVSWFPARRLRQVLLVAFAPAIAYLFNLFRVGVMVVAPTSEFSTNHARQGLAVFFGAVVCVILLDRVLGRLLPGRSEGDRAPRPSEAEYGPGPESSSDVEQGQQPENEPASIANAGEGLQSEADPESDGDSELERPTSLQGPARSNGRFGTASLVALAVAMLGVSIWMPRWDGPESRRLDAAKLPAELDGWTKTEKIDIDGGFLWTVRFRKQEYWRYERNGDAVTVFIGYDDRTARGRSLLSPKNALPRRGWEVVERSSVTLEAVESRIERVVARSETVKILTYHWYEGVNGLASEILRALLATDQSRFRRSQPARVIRVATALGSTPLVRQEQEATLRAFASSFSNALSE